MKDGRNVITYTTEQRGMTAKQAEDLRTFCSHCPGYCCYRLEGATLYLDAVDINRIARHFGISDGQVRKRFIEGKNTFKVREDGSCIFLSNEKTHARCSIHEARPRQCREFPYGGPCPYLDREDLLAQILPRIERVLLNRGRSIG